MLKNFDNYCEQIILEGRKPDDKKKFKINVEKIKQHIDAIGDKHQHYKNDKQHFLSICDELNPSTVYTPKTFIEHVKSIMKGFGKTLLADGYGKLLYSFLKDKMDSPFEDYNKDLEEEQEENKQENSTDDDISFDEYDEVEDDEIENFQK